MEKERRQGLLHRELGLRTSIQKEKKKRYKQLYCFSDTRSVFNIFCLYSEEHHSIKRATAHFVKKKKKKVVLN